jgi:2-succinyl-5-enolpyruvyl-6-hydroxy-3-cyclohexene-1-carboxylate synthase
MTVSSLPLAQAIIQHFKHFEVQHIVISPGSRNAPLTLSFGNDDYFKCYSIPDERSAAFFALGMAQQLQKPVALLCTSGSALLNYYPAIAEAFYSQIPLIILSADRPKDKIDIGDGQTIRQDNVFVNHIIYSKTLNENDNCQNDDFIHEAIEKSILKKGPVHLNLPFEEPLYETVDAINRPFRPNKRNIFTENFVLDNEIINLWQSSTKKLVLIGDLQPNAFNQIILNDLLLDETVLVLSEKSSNLHHKKIIDQIDVLITPLDELELNELQPDLLLTFGGMLVSKRIKAFLRNYKPKFHIHIDELRAYDTFYCLSHHIKFKPDAIINELIQNKIGLKSTYQKRFLDIFENRKLKSKIYLSQLSFCDLEAFKLIIKHIPDCYHLQIGNSSPIRYLQLFETKSTWQIYCNRGTSGIDGSTSTAMGASQINELPAVLITGDISFFYDTNGLWHKYIKENFGIILINNGGGGIFRILPGHQDNEVFNEYFETQHQLSASHLAKMHQLDYYEARDSNQLSLNLKKIFKNLRINKPFLLEIFTPTTLNNLILKDFFKNL